MIVTWQDHDIEIGRVVGTRGTAPENKQIIGYLIDYDGVPQTTIHTLATMSGYVFTYKSREDLVAHLNKNQFIPNELIKPYEE